MGEGGPGGRVAAGPSFISLIIIFLRWRGAPKGKLPPFLALVCSSF